MRGLLHIGLWTLLQTSRPCLPAAPAAMYLAGCSHVAPALDKLAGCTDHSCDPKPYLRSA